jgi:DNA-binding MarR family transcriptional regulator
MDCKGGLLVSKQSETDERQKFLSLTVRGRAVLPLDERSNRDVAAMLEELSPTERKQLVDAIADGPQTAWRQRGP